MVLGSEGLGSDIVVLGVQLHACTHACTCIPRCLSVILSLYATFSRVSSDLCLTPTPTPILILILILTLILMLPHPYPESQVSVLSLYPTHYIKLPVPFHVCYPCPPQPERVALALALP